MKLKKGELRVFYSYRDTADGMDADIEKVLKKYGYKRWVSDYSLLAGVRVLCFEKRSK